MINRDEIRAFIAISLPGELKSVLKDLEEKLRTPRSRCAKWVDPGSMHLTLKFLGNVGQKQVEEIKKDLETQAKLSKPLSLVTAETGCFPNMQRPRVFWIGLNGEIEKLLDLQSRIDESTGKLGFPRESRPFTAHLTLARLRDDCGPVERKDFAGSVKGAYLEQPFSMTVNAVSLIRSRLTPTGAIYTRLAEFKLGDG